MKSRFSRVNVFLILALLLGARTTIALGLMFTPPVVAVYILVLNFRPIFNEKADVDRLSSKIY